MRLKIIMLCCLMVGVLSEQSKSTHFIGGEIFYECLNPSVGYYRFTVKLYRDCYTGVPPFDDPIYISLYDTSEVLFTQMTMPLPPIDILENNTYNYCMFAPTNICVEEAVYTLDFILPPGTGTYYFTYQRCCRNQGILNIPNPEATGFGFEIVVPDTAIANCNSSPYYNQYPATIICVDAPFEYDHSAYEPDGDSLVYFLCGPKTYDYGAWGIIPNPSGPPSSNLDMSYLNPYDSLYPIWAPVDSFRIDPVTGWLTGTPTQVGRYVVAVCVSEYRDGVLLSTNSRDFQFNVQACTSNQFLAFSWETDSIDSCLVNFSYQGQPAASYNWDFGVPFVVSDTSNLQNPTYTFPSSGIYTISLITNEAYSCADTIDAAVTLNACNVVSVPETQITNENQIHLYPNPGHGSFTLDLGTRFTLPNILIQVYRIDGRQIFEKNFAGPKDGRLFKLNLNEVSKGIYFLKAETGKEILTKRLIVL